MRGQLPERGPERAGEEPRLRRVEAFHHAAVLGCTDRDKGTDTASYVEEEVPEPTAVPDILQEPFARYRSGADLGKNWQWGQELGQQLGQVRAQQQAVRGLRELPEVVTWSSSDSSAG